jgi:predicted nucleic acid-binding protein
MPEIVFDTSVISNFALAGALGVLEGLYGSRGRAYVTDFVAAEIVRGIQSGHARLEAIPKAGRAGWLKETGLRTGKEREQFETLSVSLGLGEASSIAIAKRRGFRFAADDRVARAEATRIAVPVTGTLGILVKAVRAGVCDLEAAERYLEKMTKAGFFSPVRSVREIA